MNIKSLLLGSAAALVAVSGARAADAIIAAEPEPVEYVRVCDAFGTGYFYIPGTETCLRISGYVRVQNNYNNFDITGAMTTANVTALTGATLFAGVAPTATAAAIAPWTAAPDTSSFAQTTRGRLAISAKSDTEYGMLEGFFAIQANDGGSAMILDEAFLSLGGLKMGVFYHWNDRGLSGETDSILGGVTRFNSIAYEMNSGAYRFGVSLDQQTAAWAGNSATFNNTDGIGVSGILGGTFGAVTADVVGFYDTNADEGGVVVTATADIGPGKLGLLGAYNTGANAYYVAHAIGLATGRNANFAHTEWMMAAQYAFAATEKLTLTPAVQYASYQSIGSAAIAQVDVGDAWKVGLTADYAITEGLGFKAAVNYEAFDGNANISNVEYDQLSGFLRLQRSF